MKDKQPPYGLTPNILTYSEKAIPS